MVSVDIKEIQNGENVAHIDISIVIFHEVNTIPEWFGRNHICVDLKVQEFMKKFNAIYSVF